MSEKPTYEALEKKVKLLENEAVKRKEVEEKLRESKKRMELALQAADQGMWDWDIRTGEVVINDRLAEMLGYSPEEIKPRLNSWKKLIHPDDISLVTESMSAHLEGRPPLFELEYRMRCKSGDWIWILDRGKVMERDANGNALRMTGMHLDITERIRMERQLRQAHKMEAIGTLASGIAHDFNNILTPILIHSEIVLSKVPDAQRFHLEQVLRAAHRAKNLVRQILTFCRESEQKKEPMELNPIIKEATKFLTSTLPATIEVRQNIEAESGIVLSNPIQIHQVLMNLCSNAAHAMQEKGGVLEIELTDVNIDSASQLTGMFPGPHIRLTVSDTGHGIKKKVMKNIFDPFFTTKERGEGTGMGLAVVHGIVENSGGAIEVDSKPGKGTRFHIYFPKIGEWRVSQIENIETFPRGSERILFVDNEEAITEAAKWMLHTLGYEVFIKSNGLEALELFREDPVGFDLVITDQAMPKMTGAEMARELIKVRPDIPIVLCTGFNELIAGKKAKAMGLREVVTKPIVMSDMAETIRRVLDGRRKRRKRVSARA